MGPDDFKPKDGLTDEWPISYDEIKPYYDRVDRMIGIYGTVENYPNEPDGIFLKPPKPRLNELYIMKGAKNRVSRFFPAGDPFLPKHFPEIRTGGSVFTADNATGPVRFTGIFHLLPVWSSLP